MTVRSARTGFNWTYSVEAECRQLDYLWDPVCCTRTQYAALEAEEGVRVAGVHRRQEEIDGERMRNGFAAVQGDDQRSLAASVKARALSVLAVSRAFRTEALQVLDEEIEEAAVRSGVGGSHGSQPRDSHAVVNRAY